LSEACLSEGPPCECILSISTKRLLEIDLNFGWAPIADGVALESLPFDALRANKVQNIPIMVSSTLEDCFPVLADTATDSDFKAWLQAVVPAKDVQRAYDLYLGRDHRPELDWIHKGLSTAHWAAQRAKADRSQACVARRVARRWRTAAWQYLWDTRFWGEDTSGFGPGIAHSSDQHFLFQKEGAIPEQWQPTAEAFQKAVASFVQNANPGSEWPLAKQNGLVYYKDGPVVQSIRPGQCDFWDEIDGA
jgi:hypothetical protein